MFPRTRSVHKNDIRTFFTQPKYMMILKQAFLKTERAKLGRNVRKYTNLIILLLHSAKDISELLIRPRNRMQHEKLPKMHCTYSGPKCVTDETMSPCESTAFSGLGTYLHYITTYVERFVCSAYTPPPPTLGTMFLDGYEI